MIHTYIHTYIHTHTIHTRAYETLKHALVTELIAEFGPNPEIANASFIIIEGNKGLVRQYLF